MNKLELNTIEHVKEFSEMVAGSGLAPVSFNTKEKVLLAVIYGQELNITPMQALQGLTVINGKIAILGDLARALCEPNGNIKDELIGQAGTDGRGVSVTVERTGKPPLTRSFTIADAKRANLWGKKGPWTEYPNRMVYYRALGFALRDGFPDVLKGLKTAEEVADYPDVKPLTVIANASERVKPLAPELVESKLHEKEEEQKPKRSRRTKAEMEAARAKPEPDKEVYVDAAGQPDDLDMSPADTVEDLSETARKFVEVSKEPSVHQVVSEKLKEGNFTQEAFVALLRQFKLTREVMLEKVDPKVLDTVLSKWDTVVKRLSVPAL